MTYREPIPVETRTEHAVKQAWTCAQVILLMVVVGWAYILAWNAVTFFCRGWFRKIEFTAESWLGGYIIGAGFGWFWIMRDLHPFLVGWWPVAALITLCLLRLETVGYRQAQRETLREQLEQEPDEQEPTE